MKFLRVSIFTRMDRNEAIAKVNEVIGECGGWIVNHALFSNLMITINFELPSDQAVSFIENLDHMKLSPEVEYGMPEVKEEDLRGQIMVSFIHNDPDLKRDVPAFG